MENSFFEYRDHTGVESDSESEIIDNSYIAPLLPKTPGKKNETVFVPESDDSTEDESEKENAPICTSKAVAKRSSIKHHVIISSDDDSSRGSIRRQSHSSNKVVITSSEDEAGQVSPELIPKRRPPVQPSPKSSDSFIGRKKKKHMFIIDSESDNSFIKEYSVKKKCLKDTPVKIDGIKKNQILKDIQNMSIQSNDSENNDDGKSDEDDNSYKSETNESDTSINDGSDSEESGDENDNQSYHADKSQHDKSDTNKYLEHQNNGTNESSEKVVDCANKNSSGGKKNSINTSDEGLDEDLMVMSRATRMSIMGVIPKENDSDDSDYIQSDDTTRSSDASSIGNLCTAPEFQESHAETPQRNTKDDEDSSQITCSPIAESLLHDLTKEVNDTPDKNGSSDFKNNAYSPEMCNVKIVKREVGSLKESKIDDDVTIIDKEPEIIALSSDDEYEANEAKKSPNIKKSPKPKEDNTAMSKPNNIKQYLAPPSYPNQVLYVKRHVRENELSKLNGLKEDLQNVRYLLENMDVDTLPDGGAKLMERQAALEEDVRRQGNYVANMVVESEVPSQGPSKHELSPKDKGLSWDEIQKGSNAVQPRMFGKQAMATHMAERNLILERLRDLYESLASRPPEHQVAKQPVDVRSELMDHQLHALAWLRWRETQRPCGGILADDMGLGKTITMISLIVSDKEGSIDNDEDDDDDDSPRGPRLAKGGTLVVCPATLVAQWAGEVKKHCAAHALSVTMHHGAARATQPHRLASSDLVITTYNILQRETEKNGVLSRVRWRRVILDEAHVVRNHKSATSQGVCALSGKRRWALTGTPLHNKDLDLFALLKFLRCTPFDDLTMWKKWIDNKSLGGSERLNTIMSCVMLRRTKQLLQEKGQLKCLPERSSHDCTVTLGKEEMNVYQKVLVFSKTLFAQFLHQRAEKQAGLDGFVSSKKDSEYAKMHKKMIALQGAKPVKSHEILVLLLRLRQVCCHCGLIAAMLDHDNNTELAEDVGSQDLLAELNKLTLEDNQDKRKSGGKPEEDEIDGVGEGTTAAEAIKSVLSPNNPVFDLKRQSSKIKAVMDCLKTNVFKNKGDKAVVVSQWTSVLGLMEKELRAAGVRCVTLCGDVPVPARAALVGAINDPRSDVKVMLLSLCAGGVGLNLCGANHLLLLDPHWNPQLEEQAQDRIYRVGQTKPVHIYKFMCVDTVEQSIRQLQKNKLEMADSVLTGARNTNGSKLSIEELKVLFNMGPQQAA